MLTLYKKDIVVAMNFEPLLGAVNPNKTWGLGQLTAKNPPKFSRFYKLEELVQSLLFRGGTLFIIGFTSRRKGVKPMTEGGRAVLVLFVTAAAASDLRRGRIPNFLTFSSLAGGFWLLAMRSPEAIPQIAGGMLLVLAFLYPFWKGGGLGAGDIKLLMALVPFMGIRWFVVSFVLSFLIGAGISAVLLIRDRDLSRTVHFAVPVGISVMLCLLLEQLGIQSPTLF